MKIAHIRSSPAAAGALTAKVLTIAEVPVEKTEMSQGNIFKIPAQIKEERQA